MPAVKLKTFESTRTMKRSPIMGEPWVEQHRSPSLEEQFNAWIKDQEIVSVSSPASAYLWLDAEFGSCSFHTALTVLYREKP